MTMTRAGEHTFSEIGRMYVLEEEKPGYLAALSRYWVAVSFQIQLTDA